MKKALVRVNWNKSQLKNDINPVVEKYENYLRCRGFRESSILQYKDSIKKYLNKTKSIKPPVDNAMEFRDKLLQIRFKTLYN